MSDPEIVRSSEARWAKKVREAFRIKNLLLRSSLSECFATFTLTFLSESAIASQLFARRTDDILLTAVGQGLAIMMAIYVGGGASGGFVNPAVVLGFGVLGKLTTATVVCFWIGQYTGAFVASAVAYAAHYEQITKFGNGKLLVEGPNSTAVIFTSFLGEHQTIEGAFVHEMLATMMLLACILAATDKRNWKPWNEVLPVVVGLLIMVLTLGFSFQSGFTVNPARDFSPRIFIAMAGWGGEAFTAGRYWFWVPLAADHVGALLGSFVYYVLISMHLDDPP